MMLYSMFTLTFKFPYLNNHYAQYTHARSMALSSNSLYIRTTSRSLLSRASSSRATAYSKHMPRFVLVRLAWTYSHRSGHSLYVCPQKSDTGRLEAKETRYSRTDKRCSGSTWSRDVSGLCAGEIAFSTEGV